MTPELADLANLVTFMKYQILTLWLVLIFLFILVLGK